jgi:hypothetical protein
MAGQTRASSAQAQGRVAYQPVALTLGGLRMPSAPGSPTIVGRCYPYKGSFDPPGSSRLAGAVAQGAQGAREAYEARTKATKQASRAL